MNLSMNFSELSVDNIGKWPKPIKYGIILITVMLLFIIGYQLLIKSNIEESDILATKEKKLRTDFESFQEMASNLNGYRVQMEVMQERFGNMLKQLPTKNEMPGLLEDISKTGRASGLTFDLFAPQPEVKHDFYIEVPIQIVVVGNYHQLAVFLSRVGQMGRIVTLHDFVIEGAVEDKQKAEKIEKPVQGEKLVMTITATIYRYRTQ